MERRFLPNMERWLLSSMKWRRSRIWNRRLFPNMERRRSCGNVGCPLIGCPMWAEAVPRKHAPPHDHLARLEITTCVAFGVAVLSEHS